MKAHPGTGGRSKANERIPIAYALHSGNLYGTERIALATMDGLADVFDPTIIAPEGRVHAEARRMGLKTRTYRTRTGLLRELWGFAREHRVYWFDGLATERGCRSLLRQGGVPAYSGGGAEGVVLRRRTGPATEHRETRKGAWHPGHRHGSRCQIVSW